MNIIKMDLFSQTIKTACSVGLPQTSTEKSRELTGATVMATSIQVFLQVSLLCCVVTTSIGGITDWQKAFSQLENKVKQLEKRLEPLEAKGILFGKVRIQLAVPTLHT